MQSNPPPFLAPEGITGRLPRPSLFLVAVFLGAVQIIYVFVSRYLEYRVRTSFRPLSSLQLIDGRQMSILGNVMAVSLLHNFQIDGHWA
jgi:hypothetical protein